MTTEAMRQAQDTQAAVREFVSKHGSENTATFLLLEADRAITALRTALDAQEQATAPAVPAGWRLVPADPTLDMGWAYLNAANESSPEREHSFNHAGYRAMLASAPAAPVVREREAGWWSLVMNAASAIEDAANCLRDPDAKSAAEGAAKHYRQAAQAMWAGITSDATQAAPVVPQPSAPVVCRVCNGRRLLDGPSGHPEDATDCPACEDDEAQQLADAAQQGEAVAEVMSGWVLAWAGSEPLAHLLARHPGVRIGSKLYTAPPARQAVALTDADAEELWRSGRGLSGGYIPFIRAIERAVWQANGITPAQPIPQR